MITPGFSLTAIERVLPKLALDFTTASLDPRVTFTRALNTATAINSSGYVAIVNANLPRFDYDPITLVCKGLLIEESRANVNTYSSDYSQSVYVKTRCSIQNTNIAAPDNTLTGQKLVIDTTNATTHRVNYTYASFTAAAYTISMYAKKAEKNYLALLVNNVANSTVWFNLNTGTVGTVQAGVTSASITPAPNGYYRCSITLTTPATSGDVTIYPAEADNSLNIAIGDGTSGIYIWGSQIELGAFPTSYIPTTTTALTRNADVASMTGTNFSSWYNASQGSLLVQGSYFSTGSAGIISINDGTTNNRMTIQPLNTTQLNFRYVSSSGNFTGVSPSFTAASTFKTAFGYIANSQAAYLGTSAYSSISSQSVIPTATQMQFGLAPAVLTMSGYIQKVSYWPQKLTNAELAAFTK